MVEAGGKKDPTDRYAYFQGLSLELINEHLSDVTDKVAGIKRHYNGPIGKLRKRIKDADMNGLVEAIGELMPMQTNPAVQQELRESVEQFPEVTSRDTASGRILDLTQDVLLFAAQFKNSGVTVIIPEGAGPVY